MISASKTTFSHSNLKILRPKVTKNIKNLRKKFCEFRPSFVTIDFSLFLRWKSLAEKIGNNEKKDRTIRSL